MDNCEYTFLRGLVSLLGVVQDYNNRLNSSPSTGVNIDTSYRLDTTSIINTDDNSTVNFILMALAIVLVLSYYFNGFINERRKDTDSNNMFTQSRIENNEFINNMDKDDKDDKDDDSNSPSF
mmetsp:Transcript_10239/g.11671  ORF Transcript_10239/g.11671 Transcript_10239/m.11671 type:complete len:122 (-) Transcript_10239:73-438(-)